MEVNALVGFRRRLTVAVTSFSTVYSTKMKSRHFMYCQKWPWHIPLLLQPVQKSTILKTPKGTPLRSFGSARRKRHKKNWGKLIFDFEFSTKKHKIFENVKCALLKYAKLQGQRRLGQFPAC